LHDFDYSAEREATVTQIMRIQRLFHWREYLIQTIGGGFDSL